MNAQTALVTWAIAGFIIATIGATVGALVAIPWGPWRLPWPEQARRVHPARLAPVISAFAIPVVLVPFCGTFFQILGFSPANNDIFLCQGAAIIGPAAVAILAARH